MSHTVIDPVGARETTSGRAADDLRSGSVGTGHIVFLFFCEVCAWVAFVIWAVLSSRELELCARLLGVALVAAVALMLLYDAVAWFRQCLFAFRVSSFADMSVLGGAAGVRIMYAFSV